MPAIYTCKCQDGREFTGTAKWTAAELRQMTPLQLAQALSEIKDFASYYVQRYYEPTQSVREEGQLLLNKYQRSKKWAVALGLVTALFTFTWALFALIPLTRYSGFTFILALLTFFSISVLIPFFIWFITVQDSYAKQYPRTAAKLEKLSQEMEKEIFGSYTDYLVTGFVLTPEYHLYDEGLETMIAALRSNQAEKLSDAAMICRKKIGPSPIEKLIVSLYSSRRTANSQSRSQAAILEAKDPSLEMVRQLSDSLHEAIQGLSLHPQQEGYTGAELSIEETAVINDYRCLTEDAKKRVRKLLHSLTSRQP